MFQMFLRFGQQLSRKLMSLSPGSFRSSAWDFPLTVLQIISVQLWFYASLCTLVVVADLYTGESKSLDQILRLQVGSISDWSGRETLVIFSLNALVVAVVLWWTVQRAKLCLDFALTCHFYHLIACWIYNGSFPLFISWWLLNISCVTITTVLGEFLCLRSEMRAIPVQLGPKCDL